MFDFKKGRIRFLRGGSYPHCHSVFIDDHLRTIIDPGSDENRLKAIQGEQPVQILINTHSHEDHFLFNYLFPNARLWVHHLDAPSFGDIHTFIDQFDFPKELEEKVAAETYRFVIEVVQYQPRQPDRLLEDGDLLELGETQIQVIHTPGHTPGHLSFYFPVEKVLFLGDLDLVKAGPYYGDKASDIDDTIRSLKRLAGIDAEVYLCSHGKEGIYPGDPVHIYRYLSVIEQRDDRLLEFLASEPKGLKEITDQGIIYGGRTMAEGAWDLEHSEKIMMLKHLQRLENRKMVKEEDSLYHLV